LLLFFNLKKLKNKKDKNREGKFPQLYNLVLEFPLLRFQLQPLHRLVLLHMHAIAVHCDPAGCSPNVLVAVDDIFTKT